MQIEYGTYVSSDAEAMVKLLGEVFSRYDPPAVAVGLTMKTADWAVAIDLAAHCFILITA